MRRNDEANLEQLVAVTRALGDETRLRLLAACAGGERCACQLVELAGLAPSTVSKHLQLLRQAGLVRARKDGRWIHYRLPARAERGPAVADALRLVLAAARREPRLVADAARLEAILALDPEELCRKQRSDDPACCSSAPATPAAARSRRGSRARSTAPGSTPAAPGSRRRG